MIFSHFAHIDGNKTNSCRATNSAGEKGGGGNFRCKVVVVVVTVIVDCTVIQM